MGTPLMISDGAFPAALSKPFLLKITLMVRSSLSEAGQFATYPHQVL
jgi:hypothetical protein